MTVNLGRIDNGKQSCDFFLIMNVFLFSHISTSHFEDVCLHLFDLACSTLLPKSAN